jgi:serine/threonine protein kinase
VARDGRLVLGDFGIVFFKDEGVRLTTTYERVGSHFWMAPWAYDNARLAFDKVNPTLDIYPLAKVLWSMIAGRDGFPYWEHQRDENNLQQLFPQDSAMVLVNDFLSKCIVREEKDCIQSATQLLEEVDILTKRVRLANLAKKPDTGPWPCVVCGKGYYTERGYFQLPVFKGGSGPRAEFPIYVCKHCGHTQIFGRNVPD